jgi:hypothetical protein
MGGSKLVWGRWFRGVTRVTGSEDGVTVSVRGGIDYEPRG